MEERYSRVPRLSDTRYSANGTKGKWRYARCKARLKCATYRGSTDLSVMGVRVGVANFWINRYILVKIFYLGFVGVRVGVELC